MATKSQWSSRVGLILAAAGSAVGLGNFLRFPGQAAKHGGGAFMLPYFVSLVVLGVPLAWAEWTIGRYGGVRGYNSAPGIYASLWRHPLAKYLGVIGVLVPLVIYSYYVLVEAWCAYYAWGYLTGDLMLGRDPAAYATFFERMAGTSANGAAVSGGATLVVIVLCGLANAVLVARGLSQGIEAFCKVAMPVLAALAAIVLVRVLFLGTPDPSQPERSLVGGLGYMWNPRPEALLSAETWLAASSQIFFSLSVGFGILVHYSSYVRRRDDVTLSALTACSTNELFEVCFGGMITIPASFVFLGALAPGALGSSFELGFITLPNVFAGMLGGRLFGFLWFAMLFVAAITSSVAMIQPAVAFLQEGFGLGRRRATWLLAAVCAVVTGVVAALSKGLVALDTLDFWAGSFLIFVLATVQALLYATQLGVRRGHVEMNAGGQLRVPRFVQWVLVVVVPAYLLVILLAFCWQNLPDKLAGYAASADPGVVAGRLVLAIGGAALAQLVRVAGRRWEREPPPATDGAVEEAS